MVKFHHDQHKLINNSDFNHNHDDNHHRINESDDHYEVRQETQSIQLGNRLKTSMYIEQMDCPTEEKMIRKQLENLEEVYHISFDLTNRIFTIEHRSDSLELIIKQLKKIGFDVELFTDNNEDIIKKSSRKSLKIIGVAFVFAVFAEIAEWTHQTDWVIFSLAVIAILISGLDTFKKGWMAIITGNLNINALMSIAVTGALLIKIWPEAAMVMVLFTLAEIIEVRSLTKAGNAISSLMKLSPKRAEVKQVDGSFIEQELSEISIGGIIRVKPGERIGLDGVVSHGQSVINQSSITGESMPVEKNIGDEVYAGTLNESGTFEYSVTSMANNSTLSRIIEVMKQAQENKAPVQRFIDYFSSFYTPIVVLVAIIVAIIPPLLFQGQWLVWFYQALVLLVIACPCALVISTPITIVSALTVAARKGILIKGGEFLEKGYKLKYLALDKTGTITYGRPRQTNYEVLGNHNKNKIRELAYSLANLTSHPVSQAIVRAAVVDHISLQQVVYFKEIIGRGVQGQIDGKQYYLGNHRLVHEMDCCNVELEDKLYQLEAEGKTVVVLVEEKNIIALFAVADVIKESSMEAISKIHDLGVETFILSGDNISTVNVIAKQAHISHALGEQLPEDKLNTIEKLKLKGITAMVGDGINDAPALASADIGFVMGGIGSDTAIEIADIALMDDNLNKIPSFIKLSYKAHRILIQNIILAIGIKIIFLILTLSNMATMWMAVFADMGVSLLVVMNSLRLLVDDKYLEN